jgi:hypothetical protein
MSTSYFFFFLVPMAIASSWAFGAMMEALGNRRNWIPKYTFWTSAMSYCVVGFVIPLLLLEAGYSDTIFYWMFSFLGAALVWLVIAVVLNWQKRQKSQSVKPVSQDRKSQSLRPAKTARPISDSLARKEEAAPQAGSAHIFVSYRRSDSADVSGRIYDRLIAKFGKETVFKDVDSIPLGLDFKEYLDKQVGECNVLLAIIGDRWLEASDVSGERRLDDPADFVRIEIESALERGIPVIPLLVRDAKMPSEEQLPATLKKLVYRNGTPIRSDPDFHRDMDRLISALEKYVK